MVYAIQQIYSTTMSKKVVYIMFNEQKVTKEDIFFPGQETRLTNTSLDQTLDKLFTALFPTRPEH